MGWWYASFAATVALLSNLVLFPEPSIIGISTVCAFIAARLGSAIAGRFEREPHGLAACMYTWWLFGPLWSISFLGPGGLFVGLARFGEGFVLLTCIALLFSAPACILGTILFNGIVFLATRPQSA